MQVRGKKKVDTKQMCIFYVFRYLNEKGERKLIVTEKITKRFINVTVIAKKRPYNKTN